MSFIRFSLVVRLQNYTISAAFLTRTAQKMVLLVKFNVSFPNIICISPQNSLHLQSKTTMYPESSLTINY